MITFAANFLCCRSRAFNNFFCRLSLSFLLNSSGGIGSPLQLWGWALCAGLPGPFFVCSFFLHFALLFWNHTWKQTNRIWLLSVLKRKHSWRKYFWNENEMFEKWSDIFIFRNEYSPRNKKIWKTFASLRPMKQYFLNLYPCIWKENIDFVKFNFRKGIQIILDQFFENPIFRELKKFLSPFETRIFSKKWKFPKFSKLFRLNSFLFQNFSENRKKIPENLSSLSRIIKSTSNSGPGHNG